MSVIQISSMRAARAQSIEELEERVKAQREVKRREWWNLQGRSPPKPAAKQKESAPQQGGRKTPRIRRHTDHRSDVEGDAEVGGTAQQRCYAYKGGTDIGCKTGKSWRDPALRRMTPTRCSA